MELVGAGFGEDFDAPVAQFVVLRRKGVLVDADFADRRFWRKLPAGESIDINLPAAGACRRTGQRIEFVLQFVGIVGERIEIFALDDDGSGVAVRTGADAGGIALYLNLLLFHGQLQNHVLHGRLAAGNLDAIEREQGESLCGDGERVAPGLKLAKAECAIGAALERLRETVAVGEHDRSRRNQRSGGIGDGAEDACSRGLAHRQGCREDESRIDEMEKKARCFHDHSRQQIAAIYRRPRMDLACGLNG